MERRPEKSAAERQGKLGLPAETAAAAAGGGGLGAAAAAA